LPRRRDRSQVWRHETPVTYSISDPAGPRCTPLVDGGRVYTLGAEGHLLCFDAASGAVRRSRNLREDYGEKSPLWGYSAHPVIADGKLYTIGGGKEGCHTVALDPRTGEEIWRSGTSEQPGYSPPTIVEAGGTKQLLSLRPNAVVSMNPATDDVFWEVPYQATNGSIIMSPVTVDGYVYAAGYSNQNLLLELASDEPRAKEAWRNVSKLVSPVNVQPIVVGDVLYGFDQKGTLRAVKLPEGELLWETMDVMRERPVGCQTAFLVRQGDSERFWLFNERGELVIAKLSPEGYEEVSRAKVIDVSNNAFGREVVWTMPAFANRRAYVRNDDEIVCVYLAASSYAATAPSGAAEAKSSADDSVEK